MTIITVVCSAAIGGFLGTKLAEVTKPAMDKIGTKIDKILKKEGN